MIYAGILAGGENRKISSDEMPMQFMSLGTKPILIHTLEQFMINPQIDEIIVAAPKNWRIYTEDLIRRHVVSDKRITVIGGGENKYRTIIRIAEYIENSSGIDDSDVCVFHDAVRPFVTQRIIDDNLKKIGSCNAVSTVVPSVDTIIISEDGKRLDDIPPMSRYFMEQTPQTFRLSHLLCQFRGGGEDVTRTNNAFTTALGSGEDVRLVQGESSNIKIVRQYDYELANILLKDKNDD